MKNLKRKSDIDRNKQTSKNRLEARKATVVPDLEISALTKQQKDDATLLRRLSNYSTRNYSKSES